MSYEMIHITKEYQDKQVLVDFSLKIEKGEQIALGGPSGCGKTTILRLLLGLEKPEKGKIKVPQNERISMVFQEPRLFQNLSVYNNLAMMLLEKPDRIKEKIYEGLERMGLEEIGEKNAGTLSGGMAKRVALLRGLLYDGETVILDEPFAQLDVDTKEQVMIYTKKMVKNKTLILVTHDLEEARFFNTKIQEVPLAYEKKREE